MTDDEHAIERAAQAIAEADGHMTEGEARSCARAALGAAARGLVHDAAQHHPDACSRNPRPGDTASQSLDEMTCPDCLRFIIRSLVRTPYEPPHLREIVDAWTYKPGWSARLALFREDGEARGWALYIVSDTENSLDPTKRIRVVHEFLVPPASWNRDVWAAWVLDRHGDVEMHERNEFARINGVREFAPHHGNGEDPYRTWHVSDYATAAKRSGDD